MAEIKHKLRWFDLMAYEEEAKWLSEMHADGWRFVSVNMIGWYTFEKCQPEEVVYQLDFFQNQKKDESSYRQMFADCGWEYVATLNQYHYFRKPKNEMDNAQDEEIFCDEESRYDMLMRIYKGRVLPLIVIFCATIVTNVTSILNHSSFGEPIGILYIIVVVLYWFIFVRFLMKYHHVKQRLARF